MVRSLLTPDSCLLTPLLAIGFTVLVGCAQDESIKFGSKAFTESVILGELLTGIANANEIEATHRSSLGGTQILFQALKKGEIDAYPDYTGTIALEILRDVDPADEQALRESLRQHGIGMTGKLGFNNTYALGMREDVARRLNVSRISDLARREHAKLQFGFSEEFMNRADGWPGLKQRYNLPHTPRGSDHSINYTGVTSGSVDVIDLYSTDPEIKIFELRVLEDDLHYFPSYECVVLYRLDLEQRSPDFMRVLESLVGTIDNSRMIDMNTRVRGSGGRVNEAMAAAEFLNEQFGLAVEARVQPWHERLLYTTLQHLRLVAESLSLAVIIAVPLGIWSYKWPRLGHAILSVVGVLQTLPSMAVLVLLVPLMGLGPGPAVVALFFYSLLPIVRNTFAGLNGIVPSLKESAEVLGLPPAARLWRVELPLASPSILAGIKTAAVINVGTATIGALIGAGGYGEPILTGLRLMDKSLLLQGAIPAAAMAVLVQFAFDGLERFVVPKGLRLK